MLGITDTDIFMETIQGGNEMKLFKKILAMGLVLAMMTSILTACGTDEVEEPPVDLEAENETSVEVESKEETTTEEGMKIAIVTSPSGVDDGSFNQDNYNGILSYIEKNPTATVTAIEETTGDAVASVQAVADIVADYDVIVTPGFQFAGISQLAIDNPEKQFILIDSNPAEIEGQTEFDNIYAMTFAEEESGFFAGIAAALETTTKKVAVVNGVAFPSNVNYQFGFESGVNYANANLDTEVEIVEIASYAGTDVTGAEIGGNYVGSFADEVTGKVVGKALIDLGVDTLFVAAGGSGNGVFTAVKEATDVQVIGCDIDQFDDGVNGDSNIMLTSALKIMSINVERALTQIQEGTFEGKNEVMKADTDSTGYVSADGRNQLSPETIVTVNETYELVKAGTIVPASNFNGSTPEDFQGLK